LTRLLAEPGGALSGEDPIRLKPHLRKCWGISPEANGEFVAAMEDVLEVYKRPYAPKRPVICMDEQPTQLIKETRIPLPAEPGRPECFDYEYERNGTASNFMFTGPLGDWRKVNVRERKTKRDWAEEVEELLDEDYGDAETVVLVMDNLNTHTPGALYKAFAPAEARRLLDRQEIHYTPQARKLAEHRRDRTERVHAAVSGSSDSGSHHARQRSGGLEP